MNVLTVKIRVLLSYLKHYFYDNKILNVYYTDSSYVPDNFSKKISSGLVSNTLIITKDNIESLEKLERFIEPAFFIKMRRFILNESVGFYLVGSDNDLLSFGIVSPLKRNKISPLYCYAEYYLKLFDNKKFFLIHHCHTIKKYRNRGLYTYLLYKMITSFLNNYIDPMILIDAAMANIPANKAICRSGFQKIGQLKYKNITGMKFYEFKKA